MPTETINISGLIISKLNKKAVLSKIELILKDGKQHYIVTPNPEFALEAEKNNRFYGILKNADLSIADGIGLKFAAWARLRNIVRFTGADLVKEMLKIASDDNRRVLVVNWSRGLSNIKDIENYFQANFPGLKYRVVANEQNSVLADLKEILEFKPALMFVALGAPWQEYFIEESLKNIPSINLAIGIGGAFDFLTGKVARAPKIFRSLGLEWLWRVIRQPKGKKIWRLKRIFRAVVIFPLKFIKWQFINPFCYRPNVAGLLYRRTSRGVEVLIAERKNYQNHWQLPQGGIDGDTLENAGQRELEQEIGTDSFKTVKTYKNLYKYKVHDKEWQKAWRWRGQKQSLYIAEYNGNNKDMHTDMIELLKWRWVPIDKAVVSVHPERQERTEIYINKLKELL